MYGILSKMKSADKMQNVNIFHTEPQAIRLLLILLPVLIVSTTTPKDANYQLFTPTDQSLLYPFIPKYGHEPTRLPTTTKDTNNYQATGPVNTPFLYLLKIKHDFDLELNAYNPFSIRNEIFPDGNPKSGKFYYLPNNYSLSYDFKNQKYDFEIIYGESGKVTITAILKPKILQRDIDMVREILIAEVLRNKEVYRGVPLDRYGQPRLSLEPIPLNEPPIITNFDLNIFNISEKNISITPSSDLSQPIKISFTTVNINELMKIFFGISGLTGKVQITTTGKPESLSIPFNLKIDDPRTIGSLELEADNWRERNWQNFSDFELNLTYLNILRRDQENNFSIYSWKMEDNTIPPGASASVDDSEVPVSFDASNGGTLHRIWMDYTLKTCEKCNQIAQKKIIPAVTRMTTKPMEIRIQVLTPMAFTKAALIKLSFRSIQATPEGQPVQTLAPVNITKDYQEIKGPTIYTVNDEANYEYKISVYSEDGNSYESTWIKSKNIEIVFGSKQIKDHIYYFRDK